MKVFFHTSMLVLVIFSILSCATTNNEFESKNNSSNDLTNIVVDTTLNTLNTVDIHPVANGAIQILGTFWQVFKSKNDTMDAHSKPEEVMNVPAGSMSDILITDKNVSQDLVE